MKICSKCKLDKNELDFHKSKTHKDGLASWCIDCCREYGINYRKTNKYKEYEKNRCKTEKRKEYRRNWEKTDKQKEHLREYRKRDNSCSKRKRQYMNEYKRKRRLIDPKFKLDNNISRSIAGALKGKKAGRKWESLTGYTIEDLMIHLESKFESWMNWDNYGVYEEGKFKWHIDHIKPISLFNYNGPEDEEFKECWALSNLQPLEAIENIKKGNKIKVV